MKYEFQYRNIIINILRNNNNSLAFYIVKQSVRSRNYFALLLFF